MSIFTEKQSFFCTQLNQDQVREKASQKTYRDVLDQIGTIEKEFASVTRVLAQNPKYTKNFWLYAWYLSLLLENFYQTYDQMDKVKSIQQQQQKITDHLNGKLIGDAAQVGVNDPHNRYQMLFEWIKELKLLYQKISILRNKVGLLNLTRMLYMAGRLTLIQIILSLDKANLLQKISQLIRADINQQCLIDRLSRLQMISNVLSVSLFVIRSSLHLLVMGKHLFFANESEKQATFGQRFNFEIAKRHGDFLNDLVWSTINLFTNFPSILGLSTPAVIGLTVGFMMFDVLLICWLWYSEEQKYQNHLLTIQTQILCLLNQQDIDNAIRIEFIEFLQSQHRHLNIELEGKRAEFQANLMAAGLLALGFVTTFTIGLPFASVGFVLLIVLAVSLYWSASSYGAMIKQQKLLEEIRLHGGDQNGAMQAYQQAQWTFVKNLAKYALVPIVIMAVFTVSWQLALALMVAIVLTQLVISSCTAPSSHKSEEALLEPCLESNPHHSAPMMAA